MAVAPTLDAERIRADGAPDLAEPTQRPRRRISLHPLILALGALLLVLVTADLASFVQATTMNPSMGFIDHQGHLVDHLASLFTTGSWERPEHVAAVKWHFLAVAKPLGWMW